MSGKQLVFAVRQPLIVSIQFHHDSDPEPDRTGIGEMCVCLMLLTPDAWVSLPVFRFFADGSPSD
jgi:hypothetical protein